MKDLHEKFNMIALRKEEKDALRVRLHAYMHEHPLQQRSFFSFKELRYSMAYAFSVLCIGVISMSTLAESALPGDLLYGVKVDMNEQIKSVTLRTPEARLLWQTERMELRLMELETLQQNNALTATNKEILARQITAQTSAVKSEIKAAVERESGNLQGVLIMEQALRGVATTLPEEDAVTQAVTHSVQSIVAATDIMLPRQKMPADLTIAETN